MYWLLSVGIGCLILILLLSMCSRLGGLLLLNLMLFVVRLVLSWFFCVLSLNFW